MQAADAIIINSESLRSEITQYLDVDPSKLRLIPEAVDHRTVQAGRRALRRGSASLTYGVDETLRAVRLVAVAVQELRRLAASVGARRAASSADRQLVDRRRPARDEKYAAQLHALAAELGISATSCSSGGVPLEETVDFYQAADVFVYPSFNETFGLPILEAMACGCPVVTSDTSAMPETAGGAAVLVRPDRPGVDRAGDDRGRGPARSGCASSGSGGPREFTWAATAASTLDVYREVAGRRRRATRDEGARHRRRRASSVHTPATGCWRSDTTSSCSTR